jgi:(p)ppGpp synthase/HD superfamily hydrolase
VSWEPSPRLAAAFVNAALLHRGQVRKGAGTPYFGHLMSVSGLVIEFGGDEEQAIAALLHDAIEDQAVTATSLSDAFGERVARIVVECTDYTGPGKPKWRERKETYLSSFATKSPDALLVSACDKLHNARAILSDLTWHGPSIFDRFSGKGAGTLWYYQELAAAFQIYFPGRLADMVYHTVTEIQQEVRALAVQGKAEASP